MAMNDSLPEWADLDCIPPELTRHREDVRVSKRELAFSQGGHYKRF